MILQKEEQLQRHLHRLVAQAPIVQNPVTRVPAAQRMIQNVHHQQRIQVVGKKTEVHIFN